MYSSCPECGTVFRITTNALRAADGFVRCGHCSATFNALMTLTDEPPPTVTLRQLSLPTEPARPETPAPEEPTPPKAAKPAGEDTLEFDIPEDSWSNFFDAPPVAPPLPTPPPDEPAAEVAEVGTGIGSDTVDQAGLYRALSVEAGDLRPEDGTDWEALLEELGEDEAGADPVFVISDEEGQPIPEVPEPDALPKPELEAAEALDAEPEPPAWDDWLPDGSPAPKPLPADFAAGLPGAEDRLESRIADQPFVWEPPAPPPAEPEWHRGYVAGGVLLALLLVIQLLHMQRDQLATNPSLFGPMQRLYATLGLPLWPAWDLRSYELRGSEAVADRSSPGALDILARIAVVGNERVGLPLLRVTLRDRFDKPLGSRVFQPAEYLGKTTRPREPVPPGTMIPVEISLKDPGTAAQGFDVDVCIMSRRDGVLCKAGREPFLR